MTARPPAPKTHLVPRPRSPGFSRRRSAWAAWRAAARGRRCRSENQSCAPGEPPSPAAFPAGPVAVPGSPPPRPVPRSRPAGDVPRRLRGGEAQASPDLPLTRRADAKANDRAVVHQGLLELCPAKEGVRIEIARKAVLPDVPGADMAEIEPAGRQPIGFKGAVAFTPNDARHENGWPQPAPRDQTLRRGRRTYSTGRIADPDIRTRGVAARQLAFG